MCKQQQFCCCNQVDVATKVHLIEGLAAAGLKQIEATSFVSPKWVPQLADAADVYKTIAKKDGIKYPVLVPNMKACLTTIQTDLSCTQLHSLSLLSLA